MSDALNFLVKTRPEAMGHYFAFLKDAGKHLDPKTRALISVITKVHSQTERGLRQYLKRALRDGCTAGEIIDALLMAFPALGLARIVWATDVILAMNLPEFSIEAVQAAGASTASPASHASPASAGAAASPGVDAIAPTGAWRDLLPVAEVPCGVVLRIERDGRGLFIAHDDQGIRVHDSRCPHRGTDIPELGLDGARLTCPAHGWVFDAGSGACVDGGDRPLRRIESRVQAGRVQAFW